MESVEPLEVINRRLSDYYGKAWDNRPIWRIIWSEDEFEKQLCPYSENGILLLIPEWREVPKYRQWASNRFILERLVAVPEVNLGAVTSKTSYEPVWTFEDNKGNPLPAKFEAAEYVVDLIYAAIGKKSMFAKYADPEANDPIESTNERINKLQDDLFGNETDVTDALAHGQAIVVPRNYES